MPYVQTARIGRNPNGSHHWQGSYDALAILADAREAWVYARQVCAWVSDGESDSDTLTARADVESAFAHYALVRRVCLIPCR